MARKMLRNVEKRGVHAARNGPSEDRKCWQSFELGIHGLKSWGRNRWRKVRETRNPFSDSRQERLNHLQDKGLGCTPPRSVGGGLRGTGSGGNYYYSGGSELPDFPSESAETGLTSLMRKRRRSKMPDRHGFWGAPSSPVFTRRRGFGVEVGTPCGRAS